MDKNSIIKAKRLFAGAKIGLVTLSAPEAAQNPDRVDRGILRLKDFGFEVVLSKYALSQTHGHLAASPHLLAEDFNKFIRDDSIEAIICTGGGTNANRLLPFIDYDYFKTHPKVVMGMSNPTVLLNALTAKSGIITFHGPVLVWNFGDPDMSDFIINSFKEVVVNPKDKYLFPKKGEWKWIKKGRANGRLLGGNLWSLQSLIGTPYEPDWEGSILFWEDIAKEPKRLDAMLMHLKLAGVFEKISGMVIGELVLCETKEDSLSIEEIILEITQEYNFPILHGVRLGHTAEKITLPVGGAASLNSDDGVFMLTDTAVE